MNHVIFNGTPALPHTFDYTPQCDSQMMLYFAGTGWTSGAPSKIGLELLINNKLVATTSVWCNSSSDHQAMHAGLVPYTFPLSVNETTKEVNPVTITIRAIAGTHFDVNDYVTVACF